MQLFKLITSLVPSTSSLRSSSVENQISYYLSVKLPQFFFFMKFMELHHLIPKYCQMLSQRPTGPPVSKVENKWLIEELFLHNWKGTDAYCNRNFMLTPIGVWRYVTCSSWSTIAFRYRCFIAGKLTSSCSL